MNPCVSDWNFEGDLQVTHQKKSTGPDNELVELLWQNGQVVLSSQTHRKLNDQPRQAAGNGSYGNQSHMIQDEQTVSWIHNPFEDCLEKEFCSLFNDLPSLEDKVPVKQFEEDKFVKFGASNPNNVVAPLQQQQQNPMPPPRFQLPGSNPRSGTLVGFGNIATSTKVPLATKGDLEELRDGPAMTIGSSHCGSNQVQNDPDWSRVSSSGIGTAALSARPLKENHQKVIPIRQREVRQMESFEPSLTTSSGGSGSTFGRTCRQSTGFSADHKRKQTDMEESASQSEAAELESAGNKSSSRQSGSAKRSRAAEVHNLSERRRRDRINEKMKALQELIPHCSKTDKASMLDEAIEYLKSLQLQLQVMWMGGGMGPMMFPAVQQYMSRMSMGMGLPSLTSIPSPTLSRVPLIDQSMAAAHTSNQSVMPQNPTMNNVNYPNQMQNPSLTEQYARYMSFHQMQNSTQPMNMNMNMFRFGSQAVQPSHPTATPFSGGATTNDVLSGKTS